MRNVFPQPWHRGVGEDLEDWADRLARSGYRVVSRRHGGLSRLDRADWQEAMARDYVRGFPGGLERNLPEGLAWVAALGDGAADHYRRCYSRDRITVPRDVAELVRQAGLEIDRREAMIYREMVLPPAVQAENEPPMEAPTPF